MYWCCGKTAKDAPGCKFGKHQGRSLDSDNEDDLNTRLAHGRIKDVCKCCKEVGHSAAKCANDPNYHTLTAAATGTLDQEDSRLLKIQKNRKRLYSDTLV